MGRAQAQYIRIYDAAGPTYERWQNYYVAKTVQLGGNDWEYEPFIAEGLITGSQGDEAELSVAVAATARVVRAFEAALNNGRLVDIAMYRFNPVLNNTQPQPIAASGLSGHLLLAGFTGQVVGAKGGISSLTITLGSALSPVGAQIPPRKFTTAIMGKGAKI